MAIAQKPYKVEARNIFNFSYSLALKATQWTILSFLPSLFFSIVFFTVTTMTSDEDTKHLIVSRQKQMLPPLSGLLLPHSPGAASILKDEWCVTPQGLLFYPAIPLPQYLPSPSLFDLYFHTTHNSHYTGIYLIRFFCFPLKLKHHENRDVFLVCKCTHNGRHLNMSKECKRKYEIREYGRSQGESWGSLGLPWITTSHHHRSLSYRLCSLQSHKAPWGQFYSFFFQTDMPDKWFWINEY